MIDLIPSLQETSLARQIEKDHESALKENETRVKDWPAIGQGKDVWLTKISRGFGGDNAYYETYGIQGQKITVAVAWALGGPFNTTVLIDSEVKIEFQDSEYIQPYAALARLGYIVHGTVDFARVFMPEDVG